MLFGWTNARKTAITLKVVFGKEQDEQTHHPLPRKLRFEYSPCVIS
jgi:hypothetical protein